MATRAALFVLLLLVPEAFSGAWYGLPGGHHRLRSQEISGFLKKAATKESKDSYCRDQCQRQRGWFPNMKCYCDGVGGTTDSTVGEYYLGIAYFCDCSDASCECK